MKADTKRIVACSELEKRCARTPRVTASVLHGAEHNEHEKPRCWRCEANPWTVTLRYQGWRLTVPFWTGIGCQGEPSAADVLGCLLSDANAGEQSFADFCADMGYEDSRAAERTWRECKRLAGRVRQLLGDDFDEFAGLEH